MAVLAVVTSSPQGVEGGHLVIARALVAAAKASGHDAHLVVTADFGFGQQARTYLANWNTDVRTIAGRTVDQVISLRYPSYAVRHPRHVCWINHTMREYYDLWPQFAASISWKGRLKEGARRQAHHVADGWLLTRNVTRVLAQSHTIAARLSAELDINAEVLHPPAPLTGYRFDEYGDYIFAVSRLTPLKRIDLLIGALADPAAQQVKAVIAGEGESRPALEALAVRLGVADRVTFTGHIDNRTMFTHLARCRAVCFAPFDEDYGLVTAEAFSSRKAVITCRDSGGPTELVADEETGLVCEPTAASMAVALARLTDDAALAERLGARAAAQAATMTWAAAIRRLVIV